MFGFSFSELIVVVIVALVVMGPKDLPKMLRRLGQWAGKIRRAAADLRAQSGIDDALRSEGLADDIAEIRKLARGELDAVRQVAQVGLNDDGSPRTNVHQEHYGRGDDFYVVRDREYPRDGADSYGALPDNAILYSETLPKSKLARDALYRMGDENAELPDDPPPVATTTLMGIGLAEMEANEAKAKEAKESKESSSTSSTDEKSDEAKAGDKLRLPLADDADVKPEAPLPNGEPIKTEPIGSVGLSPDSADPSPSEDLRREAR